METRKPTPLPERLLRLLTERMEHYALIILDPQGRIVLWNKGAERVFGYSSGDMLGQPASRLFPPEDVERGLPDNQLKIASAGESAQDDRWMVRADGSRIWVSGFLYPLRDADGTLLGFGKVLRNRTEVWEVQQTLRNQNASLERESLQKDVFLSTLSHELRNPLAGLTSGVQLMRLVASPSRELQPPMGIIERQVDILRRLVDDLLDVSRIGLGKIRLNLMSVQLRDVLNRAVESARGLINERRQRVEVLVPSVPIVLHADPARLYQVFVNLVTNAAKFTPNEGHIWVTATIEGDEAVVRVRDTGAGISAEMLPRIFDLFTQDKDARAQAQGGLGIGLALVRDLVELHEGTVQVRSDGVNQGSEFIVRLPLARNDDRDDATGEPSRTPPTPAPAPPRRRRKTSS